MLVISTQKEWEGSFEHPKHMLKMMGMKIFTIVHWKMFVSKPVFKLLQNFGPVDCSPTV